MFEEKIPGTCESGFESYKKKKKAEQNVKEILEDGRKSGNELVELENESVSRDTNSKCRVCVIWYL